MDGPLAHFWLLFLCIICISKIFRKLPNIDVTYISYLSQNRETLFNAMMSHDAVMATFYITSNRTWLKSLTHLFEIIFFRFNGIWFFSPKTFAFSTLHFWESQFVVKHLSFIGNWICFGEKSIRFFIIKINTERKVFFSSCN